MHKTTVIQRNSMLSNVIASNIKFQNIHMNCTISFGMSYPTYLGLGKLSSCLGRRAWQGWQLQNPNFLWGIKFILGGIIIFGFVF